MRRLKQLTAALLTAVLACGLAAPVFAAPQLDRSEAKEVFNLVNEEREAKGLDALSWNEDLVEAAEIRVREMCEKGRADHVRPDGRSFFSVSTLATGENAAYNYKSAAITMEKWMNSKGHRENILRERYKTIGVACAQTDSGEWYWVQLFGDGASNVSWANVKTYTLDPTNNAKVKLDGTGSSSSKVKEETETGTKAAVLDKNGAIQEAGIKAALKKAVAASSGTTVTVSVKGAKSVSPAVLGTMTASGKTVVLRADTMTSSGKSTQGRLYLRPAKMTALKGDIRLGVMVDSASVASIKAKMEKRYSNTMAYVHMEHSGSLGTSTKVMAKVKLDGLKTDSLQFYVYNAEKDSVTRIEKPNYKVDSKGWVTFYTSTAGDIVIADAKLSK